MEEVERIDNKALWLKLSGSITYHQKDYFKLLNLEQETSNEELVEKYLYDCLWYDEDIKAYTYLNKSNYKHVIVDDEMIEKIKTVYVERIEKKREKYKEQEQAYIKRQREYVKKQKKYRDNVIEFIKSKEKI